MHRISLYSSTQLCGTIVFRVCVILLFSFGLKIGEFLCARHNCSIWVCFQDTIMALQAKRPHIAPQTQHGKRSGIFYELFFRDILLQGRRQLGSK